MVNLSNVPPRNIRWWSYLSQSKFNHKPVISSSCSGYRWCAQTISETRIYHHRGWRRSFFFLKKLANWLRAAEHWGGIRRWYQEVIKFYTDLANLTSPQPTTKNALTFDWEQMPQIRRHQHRFHHIWEPKGKSFFGGLEKISKMVQE